MVEDVKSGLTEKQQELLSLLSPWIGCRWETGHIERSVVVKGRRFSPNTFNALVDAGLAWGRDHSYGTICVGRLP